MRITYFIKWIFAAIDLTRPNNNKCERNSTKISYNDTITIKPAAFFESLYWIYSHEKLYLLCILFSFCLYLVLLLWIGGQMGAYERELALYQSNQGHNCFLQHCSRFFIHNVTSFSLRSLRFFSTCFFSSCVYSHLRLLTSSYFFLSRIPLIVLFSRLIQGLFFLLCIFLVFIVLALFSCYSGRFLFYGSWFLPI